MNTDIIALISFVVVVITLIILYILDKIDEKRTIRLFQSGCFLDYFHRKYHGKFGKEWVFATYEILDRDKNYLWVKDVHTGEEHEIDVKFDLKYLPFVLRDKEGNMILDNRK